MILPALGLPCLLSQSVDGLPARTSAYGTHIFLSHPVVLSWNQSIWCTINMDAILEGHVHVYMYIDTCVYMYIDTCAYVHIIFYLELQ